MSKIIHNIILDKLRNLNLDFKFKIIPNVGKSKRRIEYTCNCGNVFVMDSRSTPVCIYCNSNKIKEDIKSNMRPGWYFDDAIITKSNIVIYCNNNHKLIREYNDANDACGKCLHDPKRNQSLDFIVDFVKRILDFKGCNLKIHNTNDIIICKNFKDSIIPIICENNHISTKTIHALKAYRNSDKSKTNGCNVCSDMFRPTTENAIDKIKEALSDKPGWGFDEKNYIHNGMYTVVPLLCDKGHDSSKLYNNLLSGYGCLVCSRNKTSSKEEIDWLDSINIKTRQFPISRLFFDGYDSTTNTLYEYQGSYWHGCPKKYQPYKTNTVKGEFFGQLYNHTVLKRITALKLGYNIIEHWTDGSEYYYSPQNDICEHVDISDKNYYTKKQIKDWHKQCMIHLLNK